MLGLGTALAGGFLGGGPPFSLKLDGTDDHMRVAHNASMKPTAGITVSGWVNLDLDQGATGWVNPDGDSDHDEYLIGTIASGGWGMYFSYSGTSANPKTEIKAIINVNDSGSGSAGYVTAKWGGTTSTTSTTALHEIKDFTGWIHMAFTYDGAIVKLYINGNSDLFEGDVDTSGTQVIDTGVTGKAGLNLLAASGNYDNEADLEAWWKFEEGKGTTVADSSSNSNEGALINSPSFSDNTSE